MKHADPADSPGEDEQRRGRTWGERIIDWFRRPTEGQRPPVETAVAAQSPSITTEWLSLPLPIEALDALKESYLSRLYRQLSPLHIYGLDPRRRALQDSGQALELLAVYTPLNTTRQVPREQEADTQDPRSSKPPTRPMTLLESVGQVTRAVVRGPYGSGKSTFLRFLALSMAREETKDQPPALARLQPAWQHGWLFPVLVSMDDFAASAYHSDTAEGLCAYMAAQLDIAPDQLQNQLMVAGGMLFLLDDADLATQAVVDLAKRLEQTQNHLVLTVAEHSPLAPEPGPLPSNFDDVSLAPWTEEGITLMAQRWYAELERKEWLDAETAHDLPTQLRASLRRREILSLTNRPAQATLVALLKTLRGRLPTDPVAFYQEFVNLTIVHWSEGTTEKERDLRQAFDPDNLRAALAQVTFDAYSRLELPGTLVRIPGSELRATLVMYCRDGRWEAVNDFVARLRARPGFIEEPASGVYSYTDPSLQAFVAARHLLAQPEPPRLVTYLATEAFYRWRQVILFAVARRARLEKDAPAALALVDALCPLPLPAAEQRQVRKHEWYLAWLAGEAFAEVSAERPATYRLIAQFTRQEAPQMDGASQTLARIQQWLAALIERGLLSPRERAQAGEALDRLGEGDPRPGVSSPEPLWCPVPGGPFWQGEDESAQLVDLGEFWIARYPVTNDQYAAFVSATRHRPPIHWQGDHPPLGLGNHPVVNVTWEDAAQYCEWLAEHMHSSRPLLWRSGQVDRVDHLPPLWTARLPRSIEWAKAARGGLLIPEPDSDALVQNPLPRRTYPWGDSWLLSFGETQGDETRCNVSESDIGTTTLVGMYPGGASPYGVMDMAGNVWEWCLDWADEEHRYKIRRGGAFRYTHEHARCAAADRAHPSLAWPYVGFRVVLGHAVSPTLVR